jgi:hypothetical protein
MKKKNQSKTICRLSLRHSILDGLAKSQKACHFVRQREIFLLTHWVLLRFLSMFEMILCQSGLLARLSYFAFFTAKSVIPFCWHITYQQISQQKTWILINIAGRRWTQKAQKARKPCKDAGLVYVTGCYRTVKMVEAGGVEPPSENAPLPYLHA